MEISAISQFIISIVPAVTAVIGMIVALGVGIGKIKKANSETTKEVKDLSKTDKELKAELRNVHKENAELKKQLNEVAARLKHMYFVEKEEERE